MAKYKKRPIGIEAEVYHAGLEDGFSCIPFVCRCEWADEHGHYKLCFKCPLDIKKQPFLQKEGYKLYINEGDWIITNIDGEKHCCNPEIFELTYELIE